MDGDCLIFQSQSPVSHFPLPLSCLLPLILILIPILIPLSLHSDAVPVLQEPVPIPPQIPPWMQLLPLQLQLQDLPPPNPHPHHQIRNLFYQMVIHQNQTNWIQNQSIMNLVVQLVLYSFQPPFLSFLIYYSSSVIMKLDVNCFLNIMIPFGYWWKRE